MHRGKFTYVAPGLFSGTWVSTAETNLDDAWRKSDQILCTAQSRNPTFLIPLLKNEVKTCLCESVPIKLTSIFLVYCTVPTGNPALLGSLSNNTTSYLQSYTLNVMQTNQQNKCDIPRHAGLFFSPDNIRLLCYTHDNVWKMLINRPKTSS